MWSGWPAARVLFLALGIAFLSIFVQVTLFHLRQNFRHPAMWFPVIATPLLGLNALLLVGSNVVWLRGLFAVLSVLGTVTGLVGTYYHLSGVGNRVAGYTLSNFMVGPPPMLPLMVTALGAFGLIILYFV